MSGFIVEPFPDRRIICVIVKGILTLDDVVALGQAQANLVAVLGYEAGQFDALIDVTASPIQPVQLGDALSALSGDGDFRPARIAFVHAGTAVKMQIRRINAHKGAQMFETHAEALAWLTQ